MKRSGPHDVEVWALVPSDRAMGLEEAPVEESRWGFELAPHDLFVPLDLELEGAELRAAAARLVDQRAAVQPEVGRHRRAWVRHVVRAWEDARAQHALAAYTMVYEADGLPVEAILLAFGSEREHPDDVDAEIRSLESALAVMREGDTDERHVSVVELPAGPAVRVRVLAEDSPGERRSLLIDGVSYWVPVPGEPDILLLSVSTPVLVLADTLADIADDIAQALRFTA